MNNFKSVGELLTEFDRAISIIKKDKGMNLNQAIDLLEIAHHTELETLSKIYSEVVTRCGAKLNWETK